MKVIMHTNILLTGVNSTAKPAAELGFGSIHESPMLLVLAVLHTNAIPIVLSKTIVGVRLAFAELTDTLLASKDITTTPRRVYIFRVLSTCVWCVMFGKVLVKHKFSVAKLTSMQP